MNATTATAANRQRAFPSPARTVMLAGLAGFFFANFAAQFLSAHFGGHGGMELSAAEASWISTVYTLASFVGVVAAEPLEKALGLRRYFIGSALLFATFGWLQATAPSESTLMAMRAFEGFTTGGFGPKALLATFMLQRGGRRHATLAISVFLLLVATVIGLVMLGASESVLGWRGMFLVQFGLSSVLALAGLRWLPRTGVRSTDARSVDARVAHAQLARTQSIDPLVSAASFADPFTAEHFDFNARRRRRARRASSSHSRAAGLSSRTLV